MKQIGDLFAKYKQSLRPPQATVEREAIQVIASLTTITLTTNQLSYSTASRTLTITAPSILRSEILKYRNEILASLRSVIGAQYAPHTLR